MRSKTAFIIFFFLKCAFYYQNKKDYFIRILNWIVVGPISKRIVDQVSLIVVNVKLGLGDYLNSNYVAFNVFSAVMESSFVTDTIVLHI